MGCYHSSNRNPETAGSVGYGILESGHREENVGIGDASPSFLEIDGIRVEGASGASYDGGRS